MRNLRPVVWVVCSTLLPSLAAAQQKPEGREQDRRPRLTLRAQPPVGIAPARVVFTAELVGGANDFEEFYCPTIIWEWGDDTQSESTLDCEPVRSRARAKSAAVSPSSTSSSARAATRCSSA